MDVINGWWSWALFINGVLGLTLTLHCPRIGAWYNIVGQHGWLAYGVITKQYGFVVQALTYMVVFGHLAWKTRRNAISFPGSSDGRKRPPVKREVPGSSPGRGA